MSNTVTVGVLLICVSMSEEPMIGPENLIGLRVKCTLGYTTFDGCGGPGVLGNIVVARETTHHATSSWLWYVFMVWDNCVCNKPYDGGCNGCSCNKEKLTAAEWVDKPGDELLPLLKKERATFFNPPFNPPKSKPLPFDPIMKNNICYFHGHQHCVHRK